MAPRGAETGPMRQMRRTASLGRPRSAFRAPRSALHEVLYCGYRWDPETGLYHVRYRYYHPTLGRWVSRDPIGYQRSPELYGYVGQCPLAAADAFGLCYGGSGVSPAPGGGYTYWTPEGSEYAPPGDPLPRIVCRELAAYGRRQLLTDAGRRAWDNYTNRTNKNIDLSEQEMLDLIRTGSHLQEEMEGLYEMCHSGFEWSW